MHECQLINPLEVCDIKGFSLTDIEKHHMIQERNYEWRE